MKNNRTVFLALLLLLYGAFAIYLSNRVFSSGFVSKISCLLGLNHPVPVTTALAKFDCVQVQVPDDCVVKLEGIPYSIHASLPIIRAYSQAIRYHRLDARKMLLLKRDFRQQLDLQREAFRTQFGSEMLESLAPLLDQVQESSARSGRNF